MRSISKVDHYHLQIIVDGGPISPCKHRFRPIIPQITNDREPWILLEYTSNCSFRPQYGVRKGLSGIDPVHVFWEQIQGLLEIPHISAGTDQNPDTMLSIHFLSHHAADSYPKPHQDPESKS
jgi:hypothetical protein